MRRPSGGGALLASTIACRPLAPSPGACSTCGARPDRILGAAIGRASVQNTCDAGHIPNPDRGASFPHPRSYLQRQRSSHAVPEPCLCYPLTEVLHTRLPAPWLYENSTCATRSRAPGSLVGPRPGTFRSGPSGDRAGPADDQMIHPVEASLSEGSLRVYGSMLSCWGSGLEARLRPGWLGGSPLVLVS